MGRRPLLALAASALLLLLLGPCEGEGDPTSSTAWADPDKLRDRTAFYGADREDLVAYVDRNWRNRYGLKGDEDWPLWTMDLTRHWRTPRVQVYYLGGGPFSRTWSQQSLRYIVDIYAKMRPDLTFVDYSGTECCGGIFLERLKETGISALERDAEALLDLIEARRIDGVPVVIHVSSFSTLAGVIALTRNDPAETSCTIGVFVAPWTSFYPSSFVYDPANKPFPSFELTIEERIAGWREGNRDYLHIDEDLDDDPARQWMRSVVAAAEIDEEIIAVFPEFENRMDKAVAERFFSGMPHASLRTARAAFHDSMVASPESRKAVRDFVSERLDEKTCRTATRG